MSVPNADQDAMLAVTSQSHNSSRVPPTAVKDDALVAADDSQR